MPSHVKGGFTNRDLPSVLIRSTETGLQLSIERYMVSSSALVVFKCQRPRFLEMMLRRSWYMPGTCIIERFWSRVNGGFP